MEDVSAQIASVSAKLAEAERDLAEAKRELAEAERDGKPMGHQIALINHLTELHKGRNILLKLCFAAPPSVQGILIF